MHTGLGYFPLRTDYGPGVCALPECGKPFRMRTWHQKYCRVEHQVAANNRRTMARQKAQRKARRAA